MPNPTNHMGNAISPRPASAGAATTATGENPRSALANALVSRFESPAPEETQLETQPSSDEGQPAPELADAAGAETELVEQPTPEPGEIPALEEPDLSQAPETTEAEEPGAELPKGVEKRIGQLLGKIRDLESKLTEREQSPPAQPGPLDSVTNPAELDRRAEQMETTRDEIADLLDQLKVAPEEVEQYLREHGVNLKDANGEEDYSERRMARELTQGKRNLERLLKAVPKRREYLQQYSQAHKQVAQVAPWIDDPTDERNAQKDSILRMFPSLKTTPNYEYWVAAAIEGHKTIQARLKAKGGVGRPAARPAARPAPNTASGGAARRPAANANIAAAREKVLKTGSKDALAGYLEQTGWAGR